MLANSNRAKQIKVADMVKADGRWNLSSLQWYVGYGSLGVNQGVRVKWHLPSSGWVKVNVYGSSNMNGHCLMVGGVVRDSTVNWLEGFRKYIGRASTLKSEL
ncbi:hypothetical protein PVK06_043207 [Gossypium arboreum]|uniref:Uncharacterized protein n=1 Tax=Gossypium arboreum TaxID=29729 RepID=A0ABR0MMW0_GOSAR|nr:hypothetical protein PVK06_043207 [Gossypium arboreum]